MKKLFVIFVGLGIFVSPLIVNATNVSGIISSNTVWDTAGSPYIVTGNTLVDTLVTLNIQPGVEVKIDEGKYIMVKGTLIAIGTSTDSIIITKNGTAGWNKLWLRDASICSLKYCRIEYADSSAVYSYADSLYIGYCNISNNSGGYYYGGCIQNSGLAIITDNTISNNSAPNGGGSISSYAYSKTIISNNTISNNSGGGISVGDSAIITNNTITDNSASIGGGVLNGGSATIIGNTISNNSADYGGGIYNHSFSAITGNTISNNSALYGGGGIYSYWNTSTIITYNTISNNCAPSGGSINDSGSAIIKYNTITDTTFSAIHICYSLGSDSVIIDSNNLYTTGYAVKNNVTDDIGARYNYWGTTDTAIINNSKIWDFYDDFSMGKVLYQPFLSTPYIGIEERLTVMSKNLTLITKPNPFIFGTTINYVLPEMASVSLRVYDLSGREARKLLDGVQKAGSYNVELRTQNLTAGFYFVKLVSGNQTVTSKIIILK